MAPALRGPNAGGAISMRQCGGVALRATREGGAVPLGSASSSVHYWTDVAIFSRLYESAGRVPTTLFGYLKWEYFGWPRRTFRAGAIFYSRPAPMRSLRRLDDALSHSPGWL